MCEGDIKRDLRRIRLGWTVVDKETSIKGCSESAGNF
jgi:hypothetical protein